MNLSDCMNLLLSNCCQNYTEDGWSTAVIELHCAKFYVEFRSISSKEEKEASIFKYEVRSMKKFD